MNAAEHLIAEGFFDEALPIVEMLAGIPQTKNRARRAFGACRQFIRWELRERLEIFTGFESATPDPWKNPAAGAKSIMIARRLPAKGCVVVFVGVAGQHWVTIQLFLGVLPPDYTIIFLRDPYRFSFLAGLEVFGFGYGAMKDGLRRLIAEVGCDDFYAIGTSSGGFPALHFGLTSCASGILACSPSTRMQEIVAEFRTTANAAQLERWLPDSLDVLPLLAATADPPPITLVFGGANEVDAAMSRRLAGQRNVRLYEIPAFANHDVVPHLLATGALKKLVSDLVKK